MELRAKIGGQWGLIVEGRGGEMGRYGTDEVPATAAAAADVRFGARNRVPFSPTRTGDAHGAVRTATGIALHDDPPCGVLIRHVAADRGHLRSRPNSRSREWRAISLPSLDSADSVASTTGVEYREIYLERGTLTLLQDPQARFETLLHYAQYAVTQTADGRRLDLRGVLDFRDHGTVNHDAQGNLLLTSDLDPSVVHVAAADNGGYTVQYRFSSITQPIVLFFRSQGAR